MRLGVIHGSWSLVSTPVTSPAVETTVAPYGGQKEKCLTSWLNVNSVDTERLPLCQMVAVAAKGKGEKLRLIRYLP